MVLSTGTLNLKFMQRAAARNAQSTAGSSTSSPRPPARGDTTLETPSTPGPNALAGPSISQGTTGTPLRTELSAVEKAAAAERWVLPSSARAARDGKGKARDVSEGWTFESSYMAFIPDPRDWAAEVEVGVKGAGEEKGGERAGSTRSGGGRMTFGFGEEKPEVEEEEGGEGERSGSGSEEEGESVNVKKNKARASESKHTPRSRPQGYLRPQGFDHKSPKTAGGSTTPTHRSNKPSSPAHDPSAPPVRLGGLSLHDDLPDITTTDSSANKKKRKTLPESPAQPPPSRKPAPALPAKPAQSAPSAGFRSPEKGSLDDRERALKAQKKKEKKAKKKAEKEAGLVQHD